MSSPYLFKSYYKIDCIKNLSVILIFCKTCSHIFQRFDWFQRFSCTNCPKYYTYEMKNKIVNIVTFCRYGRWFPRTCFFWDTQYIDWSCKDFVFSYLTNKFPHYFNPWHLLYAYKVRWEESVFLLNILCNYIYSICMFKRLDLNISVL